MSLSTTEVLLAQIVSCIQHQTTVFETGQEQQERQHQETTKLLGQILEQVTWTQEQLDTLAHKVSTMEFRQSSTSRMVGDQIRHFGMYLKGDQWTVSQTCIETVAQHILTRAETQHTKKGENAEVDNDTRQIHHGQLPIEADWRRGKYDACRDQLYVKEIIKSRDQNDWDAGVEIPYLPEAQTLLVKAGVPESFFADYQDPDILDAIQKAAPMNHQTGESYTPEEWKHFSASMKSSGPPQTWNVVYGGEVQEYL